MFDGFYQSKRVLVTGVAGVKGTWLALELLHSGAEVVGVDVREPEPASNFFASGLAERIHFARGDVTDLELMRSLLEGASGMFHLAAVSLVGEALRDPLEAYRTNVLGTATVLEAVRTTDSVRDVVVATTDKVYRAKDGGLWEETDPLFSEGPYPVSKACAEHVIRDYHRQYLFSAGKRLAVGRAGNVLIGGDFYSSRLHPGAGRLVADLFDALMHGAPPTIFSPSHVRPYAFGLDIVCGYMTLMSQLDRDEVNGQAFNFGPPDSGGASNAQVADRICELWGNEAPRWRTGPPRDEPIDCQRISWRKARRVLSWSPVYDLEEGLRETARWYREWCSGVDTPADRRMAAFNNEQIERHRHAAVSRGLPWATSSPPERAPGR